MNWVNIALISANLLFGYMIYLKMNQNGRHLGLNRWFLIGFPVFSIALGTIYHYSEGSVFNGFSIELPIVELSANTTSVSQNAATSNINWTLWIYASGVIFSLLLFARSLWKIRKPHDAKFLNSSGNQRIYLISEKRHSYSHLNTVYISEYQLENVDYILKHELAHCRQKHSLDLLYIRIVRAFFWFHPVLYLWEMKMKENHEYLADRACIADSNDIKPYSYALLSSHFGVSLPDLANGFNRPSMLQKRIIQLKTHNTFNMKKVILIPVALVGVVMMMSIQLESKKVIQVTPSEQGVETSKDDTDTEPEFVGGMTAMITYLQDNIIYPKELANQNLEAKVFVKFVVSAVGKVQNVTIVRGSEHEAFNTEAIRVISIMPDWTPGTKDGKTVSAEMTLPIQFTLAK